MRNKIEKFVFTKELKDHYKNMYNWLIKHPEIDFKKLYPYGLQINIGTISQNLASQFLEICYQNQTKK